MRNKFILKFAMISVAAVSLASAPIGAQAQAAGTKPVNVIVTVLGKGKEAAPEVTEDSVNVHQDGKARPVLGWQRLPEDGQGLELIVYVDGSVDASVANQLQDVSAFIRALPREASAEVVYSYGGEPQIVQSPTTDRELAAKSVRIPSGRFAASSGLYAGLEDFAKHLPDGGSRRVFLVISNGIDLLRGVGESDPGINPDLQSAIDELHRKDISVYAIYAGGGGRMLENEYLVNNGQGCLARLAAETGGEFFSMGLSTPIDFEPYLKDVSEGLTHQYLLTFAAVTSTKAHLSTLRVGVEVEGADVLAPDHVFVP
ncbi:MAG: hypothetical protein WBF06_12920 [Candidatus Acidiferrales bacterium]